jgi:hypothetical protein
MKRGRTLLTVTCIIASILILSPLTSALVPPPKKVNSKTTETIRITIGTKTVEKQMPLTTINDIIDLGKTCKEDFLTIYDKTKTIEQVEQAFMNIQPFFQTLIDNALTDKTIGGLNDLYYDIREKIQEPIHKPRSSIKQQGGAQSMGLWNGIPTPVWANAVCGIFDAGLCAGFAGGTHAIIPTIGADLFITYGFQGESITVGLSGGTLAVTAFQVIIGFVGILIALPIVMMGPYFMTGLCGVVFGIGV